MPEKDPTLWLSLWLALTTSSTWKGAIMATFISVLRILYDGKEKRWTRIVLEALICGCLSLAASGLIEWLGWPSSMAVACGGAIGFLGVTTIREALLKWTDRRVSDTP
ncbi:phage holin, lambda family [Pseudomonas sp. GV071]|uniref:phage holin, lambda family n=1 Tax=Pseudomonas sp. GV071 TaxID=2135754 RepID=UPI000D39D9B4|nr:phage holin, lambda family [Pseudomonas sp. GV071]PTQ70365.1 lambda family phage holin [Pseudomonas sp. GV071]